jgi:hypothetical protein
LQKGRKESSIDQRWNPDKNRNDHEAIVPNKNENDKCLDGGRPGCELQRRLRPGKEKVSVVRYFFSQQMKRNGLPDAQKRKIRMGM